MSADGTADQAGKIAGHSPEACDDTRCPTCLAIVGYPPPGTSGAAPAPDGTPLRDAITGADDLKSRLQAALAARSPEEAAVHLESAAQMHHGLGELITGAYRNCTGSNVLAVRKGAPG